MGDRGGRRGLVVMEDERGKVVMEDEGGKVVMEDEGGKVVMTRYMYHRSITVSLVRVRIFLHFCRNFVFYFTHRSPG